MPARPVPPAANAAELALLPPLLDRATFAPLRDPKTPWAAKRDVAVVALCWLVGMKPVEIVRARRCDWRPGGRDVVALAAKGVGRRDCEVPVLPVARDAVAAYLRAVPGLAATGPLIVNNGGRAANRSLLKELTLNIRR